MSTDKPDEEPKLCCWCQKVMTTRICSGTCGQPVCEGCSRHNLEIKGRHDHVCPSEEGSQYCGGY